MPVNEIILVSMVEGISRLLTGLIGACEQAESKELAAEVLKIKTRLLEVFK